MNADEGMYGERDVHRKSIYRHPCRMAQIVLRLVSLTGELFKFDRSVSCLLCQLPGTVIFERFALKTFTSSSCN